MGVMPFLILISDDSQLMGLGVCFEMRLRAYLGIQIERNYRSDLICDRSWCIVRLDYKVK